MNKDDLEKGLAALQAAASMSNPAARQRELLAKAQAGAISAQENDELVKSLTGGSFAEEVTSGLTHNTTLQKSIDVSDTLREYVEGTQEGLATLADRIEKSESDEHGFRLALAKSVLDMGEMIKSLCDTVETLSGQPARAPKARGAQPLEKSFGGAPPAQPQDKLSKGQVLNTMLELSQAAGGISKGGEDMSLAIAKYESTNQISKALAQEVIEFRKSSSQAA